MNTIADFITELNRTKPTIKNAHFDGKWDGIVVKARFLVDYKTEAKLDVLPAEIENGDPRALAVEVAERMEAMYRERTAMPLLEQKLG